jgi:carbamoyl-phosphate synthase large subunit
MKKNILITSAGRRVSLVKAFQADLKHLVPNGKVFTAEMNPEWASACRVSDGYFAVPRVTDPEYITALLELCISYDIGLLIPTIDTELSILASCRDQFAAQGVAVAVSDSDLIVQCRDKRNTNYLFKALGIETPAPIDKNSPTFPLFLKPYDGSLSKDILLVRNADEWRDSFRNNEKLMFMEYLSPEEYQEFTVDAYFDKNSQLKCLVPRRRIEVRGGEISKGRTEKGNLYQFLNEKFKFLPGARSCLTMQFFEHRLTGRIVGIEINPRFGGGYPLSYSADARYPSFLIREYLLDDVIDFFDTWIDKRVMLRYDAEVILDDDAFSN